MQEDTLSNNTSSGSFQEAMAVLGAFGALIDKVATVKKAQPQGDDNNDFHRCIRTIWAANKDTIKQEFPEVKHLDVEPEHGCIFVVIEDEAFDNMTVSRIKNIKLYLYKSANYTMVFDNYSHFLNNNTNHRIIL